MKLKPLSDNVVVKPVNTDETSQSGIILPETNKEKPERGEIVAVGPGKRMEDGQIAPMSVKVGDKVVFKKYSPDEIKIENKEYLLLSESDILAILE